MTPLCFAVPASRSRLKRTLSMVVWSFFVVWMAVFKVHAGDVTGFVETLGNPFAARYNTTQVTPARTATRMRLFNDRIFLGHGTTSTALQTGPVDVWSFDLGSDAFVKTGFIFEEIIDQIRAFNGRLYINGRDSMGQGSVYRFDPARGWESFAIGPDGHYFDVFQFDNKILTFVGDANTPQLAISDVENISFSTVPLGLAAGSGAEFISYKGNLYATLTRSGDPAEPPFMSKITPIGAVVPIHRHLTNFYRWGPFSTNVASEGVTAAVREFTQLDENLAVFVAKGSLHYTTNIEEQFSGVQLTNQPAGFAPGNTSLGIGAAGIRKYGDILYCTYNFRIGPEFWVALCESTDGLNWTEKFRFTKGSRARSFERAPNGDFYFGAFGVFGAQGEKLIPGDIWRVRNEVIAGPTLPLVGISSDRLGIFEGSGGALQLRIRRAGGTNTALTVHYTTSGSAVVGTDFTAPAGSATLAVGAESVIVPITVLNNPAVTGPRVLTVTLQADAAYSIVSPSTLNFTISETVPGTKLPADGLALWLRADQGVTAAGDGTVSEWADQSGRGFVARQAVANQRPILVQAGPNGRPAIQFDGVNDWLDVGAIAAEAYFTGVVFSNKVALGGAPATTLINYMSYAEGGGSGLDFGESQNNVSGETIGFYNQVWKGGAETIPAGAHLLAFNQRGASLPFTLKIDGVDKPITVNSTFRVVTPVCQQVRIASRTGPTGSRFFSGSVSEIIIYNRPLTTEEVALVEGHLNQRYFVAANTPPSPVADEATRTVGQGVDIPVTALLANDLDSDGDVLTITSVGSALPEGATVSLEDGIVRYTPAPGNDANGSFTYEVSDGRGGTASVSVTVVATVVQNRPPVAVNDNIERQSKNDLVVTFAAVLTNDSDPDSEVFSLTAVTPTTAGGATVTIENESIRYHPPVGFNGTDSFSYTITDARGLTAVGVVNITVSNAAPVAGADARSSGVGQGVSIAVSSLLENDTDPDLDAIEFVSASAASAAGGSVSVNAGQVIYTPPAGFTGSDSFTYNIRDARGLTAEGAVTTIPVRLEIQRVESAELRLSVRVSAAPRSVLELQKIPDPSGTEWTRVTEVNAGQTGTAQIEESAVGGGGFFRAIILTP